MKALLAVLALVALPVAAEEPLAAPGYTFSMVPFDCGDQFCVLGKDALAHLFEANAKMMKELADKAKEPPRCAKLEVIEPPKKQIPIDPETNKKS